MIGSTRQVLWICSLLAGLFGIKAVADDSAPTLPPLRVVSLNLHGYHPMGQRPRFLEYRDGRVVQGNSDLFFFTLGELAAGESARQLALAAEIGKISPDFVALQEVGAGLPGLEKNCETFERESDPNVLGTNTAIRLKEKLPQYGVALACRGNVGWQTATNIFSDSRVVTFDDQGRKSIVFDYGTVPYSDGLLVEGFALLFSKSWTNTYSRLRSLRVGPQKEVFGYQLAVFERPLISQSFQPSVDIGTPQDNVGLPRPKSQIDSKEMVVIANVHGGHKLRHFEQAVAVRQDVAFYLSELRQKNPSAQISIIFQGDMNESLASLNGLEDAQGSQGGATSPRYFTAPWEMVRKDLFDLSKASVGEIFPADLSERLVQANDDPTYKPWASVAAAPERVRFALDSLKDLVRQIPAGDLQMVEAVDLFQSENCRSPNEFHGRRVRPEQCVQDASRIDLIFVSKGTAVSEANVIGRSGDWASLEGLSDHPLVWVEMSRAPLAKPSPTGE